MKTLFDVVANTEWMQYAACADTDPKIFDGYPSGHHQPFDYGKARQTCSECLVKHNCLDDAIAVASAANLEHGKRFWIFQAGMTPTQLQKEYDSRQSVAA